MSSELVQVAEEIARRAHEGQVDKAGAAYIDHPRRVAARAAVIADPDLRPETEAAGWLHDVVEDTTVTIGELAAAGMPSSVLEAVDLLTRTDGVSLELYVARIRDHPVARVVKLADLIDNTDPDRMRRLDGGTQDRLGKKYARSFHLLLGVGDG